ncbi:MAG: phytoene/squalene synthase family protein, partial [bacterium]|nr:phytoene/squalene synthase family protein [bacterium]
MTVTIEASYDHCRKVAKSRARNFYYSFLLLDKPRRDGMCALYAFNRECDDLSDEPRRTGVEAGRVALEAWREQLDAALAGEYPEHAVWPAFHDTVKRFGIPPQYFHEMIDGVMSDLEPRRVETFEDLYRYCYQVASVVGLSVLYVFGFEGEQALELAEKCGIAFQLTNIIRDVKEDAQMGRVYLPAEDFTRFGVGPDALGDPTVSDELVELLRFEAARAREYYREAAPLVGMVNRRSRNSLWALIRIYARLLERIERSDFDALRQRIRLPTWENCGILVTAPTRPRSPTPV